MRPLFRFSKNSSGQGLLEYALILALLAIVAIAALSFVGKKASNTLRNAATQMGPRSVVGP